MDNLFIVGLKSKIITGNDSVMACLETSLNQHDLKEGDIVVVTSKVVAITQGRTSKASSPEEFEKLVKEESDIFLGGEQVYLTKKNNIFIPWAGIDRSNAPEGEVVLWPEKPFEAAYSLLQMLKETYGLKKLGVIISDSTCMPLRRGVTAIALGYAGFKGVNDLRGKKDLHGKEMQVSQQNMADMISVAAHLVMGESDESMPFALVRGAKVQFTDEKPDPREPTILQEECLFKPLYKD